MQPRIRVRKKLVQPVVMNKQLVANEIQTDPEVTLLTLLIEQNQSSGGQTK